MGMSLVVAALGFLRGDVWMYFIALLGMAAFAISWFVVPRLPQLEMRLVAPGVEIVGAPTFAQLVVRAGAARAPRQHVTVHAVGDTPGDRPGALPRGAGGRDPDPGPRAAPQNPGPPRRLRRAALDHGSVRAGAAHHGVLRLAAPDRVGRHRTVPGAAGDPTRRR